MGLSSNTILHTTGKKEILKILKNLYFIPAYCNERVLAGVKDINAAFPMVSFSDFPVSELKYRDSYGRYGIGLTKAWTRRCGLNPVLYVEKKSQLISDYFKQFNAIKEDMDKNVLNKAWSETVIYLLSYMKNYQGHLRIDRLKIDKPDYRFSDEREWRFVPSRKELEIHKAKLFYTGDYYMSNKDSCNKKISSIKLPFSIEDINYIIVDKESEVEECIQHITGNHEGLSTIQSHKLCSKIISMTRIKYDF